MSTKTIPQENTGGGFRDTHGEAGAARRQARRSRSWLAAWARWARLKWLAWGLVPLLSACTLQPITLAPVGPGPFAQAATPPGSGQLQVYTKTEEYWDDDLSYFPHTDYQIYSATGKRLEQVWNHHDHEDEYPTLVTLQPGRYTVKAWAEGYGLVIVPISIQANLKTLVVLQPGWNPGQAVPATDLVRMPNGYDVGWRATVPESEPSPGRDLAAGSPTAAAPSASIPGER